MKTLIVALVLSFIVFAQNANSDVLPDLDDGKQYELSTMEMIDMAEASESATLKIEAERQLIIDMFHENETLKDLTDEQINALIPMFKELCDLQH